MLREKIRPKFEEIKKMNENEIVQIFGFDITKKQAILLMQ